MRRMCVPDSVRNLVFLREQNFRQLGMGQDVLEDDHQIGATGEVRSRRRRQAVGIVEMRVEQAHRQRALVHHVDERGAC